MEEEATNHGLFFHYANIQSAILFVIVLGLYWLLFKKDDNSANLPPGPKGWPLLGNLPSLSLHSEREMMAWNKEYGPVCRLKMGNIEFIILGSVEAVQEAFVKKSDTFSGRLQDSVPGISGTHGILFLDYGNQLKEQRRFGLATLKEFGMGRRSIESSMLEKCSELCEQIDLEIEKGKPFSIDFMVYQTVSSVISKLVFNKNLARENKEFRDFLHLIMTGSKYSAINGITVFFPPLKKIPPFSWGRRESEIYEQNHQRLFQQEIDDHKATRDPKEPRDFIDCFLNEMDIAGKSSEGADALGYHDKQLKFLARDFFLAGSETTSSTICWVVLYLSRNQEIQTKMHKEIIDVLGHAQQPSTGFADKMPYMKAVIQEILRMRPLAPIAIPHRAIREGTIMGYRIPKDAMVVANIFGIQNNEETWPDPEKFDPCRHLDADGKFVKMPGMIPFSIGARQCLGMQLANMELHLIVASLFQRYRFHFAGDNDIDMRGKNIFSLRPYPFKVTAVKL
uniref:cytochrome P450 2J2-like n=1 Tax=Styela clava TaxID=7725 RepID=UPI00193A5A1C|nr:cytochrome P450 2J2-like [Styela clava]